MSDLLAVDPSLTGCGWALFNYRTLVQCGVIVSDAKRTLPERAWQVASVFDTPVRLVCEFPVIYPKGRRGTSDRVDPNDLLAVAAVAGAVLGAVGAPEMEFYKPAEWKGQAPKEKMERIVRSKLSAEELLVLDAAARTHGAKAHNAVDAVGIGLYDLNRLR